MNAKGYWETRLKALRTMHRNFKEEQTPDWPPASSAVGLADGVRRYGSTGQLWEVKGGQWIRRPDAEADESVVKNGGHT